MSAPPEAALGERLKALREKRGLSFARLAALTREHDPEGISEASLRRYERCRPNIRARALRILCDTLDVSADFLIFGREPAKADPIDLDVLLRTYLTVLALLIRRRGWA